MKNLTVIAFLYLALIAGGCTSKESQSVVFVSVTAADDMSTVTQLRATLMGAGISDTEYFPRTNSTAPVSFTPAATFVLVIPRSHSGNLNVLVDALDASSQIVGSGEKTIGLSVGERVDVQLVLHRVDQETGSGGAGGSGDAGANTPFGSSGTGGSGTNVAIGGTTGVAGAIGSTAGVGGVVVAGMTVPGSGGTAMGGSAGMGGISGVGGTTGAGGLGSVGGLSGSVGGKGGLGSTAGTVAGGAAGGGTTDNSLCGNGRIDPGELCDCGTDPINLPSGCVAVNGLFYGDGKGCSRTCIKEPLCLDSSGRTQECSTACGDGNRDANEECDDGNQNDDDGCSKDCKIEKDKGFTCSDRGCPKNCVNGKRVVGS